MLENVNMNIRKDERYFFERCSLRKKFCELPCLQSYFVCVSIILVSLSIMPTTIRNSNLSVNIRISENIRKTCERKTCVQSCFVYASLSRASDFLYRSLFFIHHHFSILLMVEKKEKNNFYF